MAAMTITEYEAPQASGLKGNDVEAYYISALNTNNSATTIKAAVPGAQIYVVGGSVSLSGAGTISLLSAATVYHILEFASAGTQPLPPFYSVAGELLAITNTGGSSAEMFVLVQAVQDGQTSQIIA